jgi:DNA-binding GntR family transcriptional regulator
MKYNFNSPIDNKVLPNKIVDYIRDKIITGELKGGEKVSEAHLSDKLQISRTPIREAIRLLECEGFVEIIPRKGAVVKKFSSEDILNTFEVKAAIEALAVRESVTKFQERDIKKLEQIIENEELYFEKGDIKKVFKEFDNFTTNLIKNCQNELLLDLNKKMTNHIIRYRFFCLKYPEILSNASEYHKKFVDIIKNREFDKIRNEYEKYYMEIGKKMLQKISVL